MKFGFSFDGKEIVNFEILEKGVEEIKRKVKEFVSKIKK